MTEIQEVAQSIIDNTIRGKTVLDVFARESNVVIVYMWDGIEEVEVSNAAPAIADEVRMLTTPEDS